MQKNMINRIDKFVYLKIPYDESFYVSEEGGVD
jgi:hypothetical protein